MAGVSRMFVGAAVAAGLAALTPRLAAQPDEYPHAFPRAGVTQIFDNTRVTVWRSTGATVTGSRCTATSSTWRACTCAGDPSR
ncbi:MAG: hypothetical protein R2708_02850 [Vicinamibacterales bacterium]